MIFITKTPVCRHDDACGMKMSDLVYNACAVSCASSPVLCPSRSRLYSRPRSHLCYCSRVCVYVCVCVFLELRITTQSDPVALVTMCHSH